MFWKTISTCLLMASLAQANDVATAWNTFALDLYRHASQEPGNFVIAPLGIAQTLAIHAAGSKGETQQELLQVLNLKQNFLADVEEHLKLLRRETDSKNWINSQSIWLHSRWKWDQQFQDNMRTAFSAYLREFNLHRSRSASSINKWLESNAGPQFSNVLQASDLNAETQWLSVNAQSFEGKWLKPFEEEDTKPAPFWISVDEKVSVPTMLCTAVLKAMELEHAFLVRLDYEATSTCMIFVVPKEHDGLANAMAAITLDDLQTPFETVNRNGFWETKRASKLYLPKFRFTTRQSYRSILQSMGVRQAFEEAADFTPMFANPNGPMFLNDVVQVAAIDVDEQGTKAKAITSGKGFGGVLNKGEFRVDRPFFFAIHNRDSNSILFMGRVSDPSKH